jgi:hypothetical protein
VVFVFCGILYILKSLVSKKTVTFTPVVFKPVVLCLIMDLDGFLLRKKSVNHSREVILVTVFIYHEGQKKTLIYGLQMLEMRSLKIDECLRN